MYGWTCALCGGYNDYKAISNRRQGKVQANSLSEQKQLAKALISSLPTIEHVSGHKNVHM